MSTSTVPKQQSFLKKYLLSLLWSLYLYSVGVLFKKNRILIYQLYQQFYAFRNPPIKKELPEKSIEDIIKAKKPVIVVEPVVVQGNVTPYETTVLNMFAREYQPKTIFEIGTFDGRTTLNLAVNSPEQVRIYTIDLPKDETNQALLHVARSDQNLINTNVTGSRFLSDEGQKMLDSRTIEQLYGDTATFDFSQYYNTSDLVFVDAAHTYEYVKNDSEIALKLLKNGKGVILWHDYDDKHQGSVQAVNELQTTHPEWQMFHIKDTNIAGVVL